MFPELFKVPFIHTPFNLYGLMVVIGFLAGVFVTRRLACLIRQNPVHITNVALYTLISGIAGARIFYVIHNFDQFRGDLLSAFAIWNGGLEFIGGLALSVALIITYMLYNKLPVRQYLDILAIALMVGLSIGRVGCFLGRGCCFGKPTDALCAVRFPYGSDVYHNQAFPNHGRNRSEPRLDLPAEYFGYFYGNDQTWRSVDESAKFGAYLKPRELLTDRQKYEVTKGAYRGLRVHPTQLYASANALLLAVILYVFWRRFGINRPGCTYNLMFVLYGGTRFMLEFLRDDNPFEYGWWIIYKGGTISQNIGLYFAILGLIMMIVFAKMKPKSSSAVAFEVASAKAEAGRKNT